MTSLSKALNEFKQLYISIIKNIGGIDIINAKRETTDDIKSKKRRT